MPSRPIRQPGWLLEHLERQEGWRSTQVLRSPGNALFDLQAVRGRLSIGPERNREWRSSTRKTEDLAAEEDSESDEGLEAGAESEPESGGTQSEALTAAAKSTRLSVDSASSQDTPRNDRSANDSGRSVDKWQQWMTPSWPTRESGAETIARITAALEAVKKGKKSGRGATTRSAKSSNPRSETHKRPPVRSARKSLPISYRETSEDESAGEDGEAESEECEEDAYEIEEEEIEGEDAEGEDAGGEDAEGEDAKGKDAGGEDAEEVDTEGAEEAEEEDEESESDWRSSSSENEVAIKAPQRSLRVQVKEAAVEESSTVKPECPQRRTKTGHNTAFSQIEVTEQSPQNQGRPSRAAAMKAEESINAHARGEQPVPTKPKTKPRRLGNIVLAFDGKYLEELIGGFKNGEKKFVTNEDLEFWIADLMPWLADVRINLLHGKLRASLRKFMSVYANDAAQELASMALCRHTEDSSWQERCDHNIEHYEEVDRTVTENLRQTVYRMIKHGCSGPPFDGNGQYDLKWTKSVWKHGASAALILDFVADLEKESSYFEETLNGRDYPEYLEELVLAPLVPLGPPVPSEPPEYKETGKGKLNKDVDSPVHPKYAPLTRAVVKKIQKYRPDHWKNFIGEYVASWSFYADFDALAAIEKEHAAEDAEIIAFLEKEKARVLNNPFPTGGKRAEEVMKYELDDRKPDGSPDELPAFPRASVSNIRRKRAQRIKSTRLESDDGDDNYRVDDGE